MTTNESLSSQEKYLQELYGDKKLGLQKLRSVAIFSLFSDIELEKLYKCGKFISLRPATHAVIEGESSRGLFIILKGTLSVHKTDQSSGNMSRLAFLEEGAPFGELSLFDAAPRSATVIAESQTHLFSLPLDRFDGFMSEGGVELQLRFFKGCAEVLVKRFREQNQEFVQAQTMLWRHALRRNTDLPSGAEKE